MVFLIKAHPTKKLTILASGPLDSFASLELFLGKLIKQMLLHGQKFRKITARCIHLHWNHNIPTQKLRPICEDSFVESYEDEKKWVLLVDSFTLLLR